MFSDFTGKGKILRIRVRKITDFFMARGVFEGELLLSKGIKNRDKLQLFIMQGGHYQIFVIGIKLL